ncbi:MULTISPECIES: DNA gyrase subunit A [unclassified Thioalkalivibrio]|uniref:DNA gyrase subunit A n=1 Tax=unclassified Thioalkalivibrio TaxID=2621013 RepID=UPI00036687A1|nr:MULTISPECIES: DNA gyrase subunit A [unclassified Thioalkalivibrio]
MSDITEVDGEDLVPLDLDIREVMQTSFLDYSLSVITDRALPDARDGLKPVHRRILYAMHSLGIQPGSPHKKSARVVGEVIGKYHPHGDSAAYEAAVRLAQTWSMRHPLIDGQGNFGSMDGDNPAAMRYTEMRLSKMGGKMFNDIGKDTVDFRDNFDGTESEPSVLPLAYPNLWVNGSDGIAVGMATRVQPHNLRETSDAFLAWMDNPEISTREIAQIMPGPDFPTGGIVHDLDGYIQALETGSGSVKLRARWEIEDRKRGAKRLVITEIPYGVNKASLVEQIADLIREKKIEGVADLREESNKKGIRIVLDIKAGYEPELIAIQLVAKTRLEDTKSYNVRALIGQTPVQMGIRDVFDQFYKHRIEVIQRRTRFDLNKALDRLHILEGFLAALDRLDETIATIRASMDAEEARLGLVNLLAIDETQAQAILDLKLQRLTGMQIKDIREEHEGLAAKVEELRSILASDERQRGLLKDELQAIVDTHGDERRTTIDTSLSRVSAADLIPEEQVVLVATQQGYLKRVSADALKRQNRGTKGRSIIEIADDDVVTTFHTGNSHDYLVALTDQGQVHAVKAYDIPDTGIGNRGRHYRNVFEGLEGSVVAMVTTPELSDESKSFVIFTRKGLVKRTTLSLFSSATRKGGTCGITLEEDDAIVCARLSFDAENESVVMASDNCHAIRFPLSEARAIGRTSKGVRGIKMGDPDSVISADLVRNDEIDKAALLVLTDKGIGKATPIGDFRMQARAGKGVTAHAPNKRSGDIAAATVLFEGMDVVIFNDAGGANRISGGDLPRSGRATAGSSIIKNGRVRNVVSVPEQADEDVALDAAPE